MRIDNLVGKDRQKYDVMAARGFGTTVELKYLDIEETEEQVLVPGTPEIPEVPGTFDDEGSPLSPPIPAVPAGPSYYDTVVTSDVVEKSRLYYVGSATLGQLGKIIQLASVAYANGANFKAVNGIAHNIPLVEAFTEAGLLSEFLGAVTGEEDFDWITNNVSFEGAIDTVLAFVEHNDFFEMVEKVMGALNRLGGTMGTKMSEANVRGALLGSLAAKA